MKRKRRRNSLLAPLLSAFGFVFLICLFLFGLWMSDNRLPGFRSAVSFYVHPGDTPEDVIALLADKAVSSVRLKRVFEQKKVEKYLSPGFYTLKPSSSAVYTARMLNNGWQSPVRLTLSGMLRRREQIASSIGNQILADSSEVMSVMNDSQFLKTLGTTPESIFEIILPDTYEIYWTAGARDIFSSLKKQTDRFWTKERLDRAGALGLSRRQVTILASIVCSETNLESEMPKVAGVYMNRLEYGMPLQADPTIAYCFDYTLSRVLSSHLKVDSPYNTYRNRGLPPGPICSPSKAALESVLNPDFGTADGKPGKGGNLYFCASPEFNGSHIFAKSYSQHLSNAHRYQEELTRRAEEKAAAEAAESDGEAQS